MLEHQLKTPVYVCRLKSIKEIKPMGTNSMKSGGGPITDKGKKTSSKNALVHGATSKNAVTDDQRLSVEQYVKELTNHYNPTSPLEILQILRIALSKAKLDALYDLEQVKLHIATEDLKRTPEVVMQKIAAVGEITQFFAESIIKDRDLVLPMGLSPEILQLIATEINGIGGKLEPEDDINLALPNLARFINEVADRLGSTPYKILLRSGEAVNGLLKDKGAITYRLRQLLQSLVEKRHDQINEVNLFEDASPEVSAEPDLTKINEALSGFRDLNSEVSSAHEVAMNFSKMQDLMLRSVTLSGEESDRLLRYQTTWERRLSSAIGELLALQTKNNK